MAQPMMHLLIADKIYTENSSSIRSYSDFLLGSIAPDAVHVNKNYTREIKDISHYRFDSKSHISYFDTFINEYHTSENKDFVVGYLVHLLSDLIWYHSVRVPFKERFLKEPSQNISIHTKYISEQHVRDYIENCAGECAEYLRHIKEEKTTKITSGLSKIMFVSPVFAFVVFAILFSTVLKGRLLERSSHALIVFMLWLYATSFYVLILKYFKNKILLGVCLIGLIGSAFCAVFVTPLDKYCALVFQCYL